MKTPRYTFEPVHAHGALRIAVVDSKAGDTDAQTLLQPVAQYTALDALFDVAYAVSLAHFGTESDEHGLTWPTREAQAAARRAANLRAKGVR